MSSDPTAPDPHAPTGTFAPTDDPTRTRKQTTDYFAATAPYDPPDNPPDECGRFRPLHFHKEGGMGRVFAAHDHELGREVALKWMRARSADQPAAVELFVREAELTGRLEHPGIAPVYGFGRATCGRPFYAMRFVRGPTLGDAIAGFHAGGPRQSLSSDDALELRRLLGRFLAVCQTMAFAHSNGVIHRDLKPGNIVLGPFGETIVLDWGLARREAGPYEPPGSRLGTPAFWAPEQEHGRPDRHDRRTDVYGLGAVLYAVLTGRPPNVQGTCPPDPPVPSEVCSWVDGELDRINATALARPEKNRYPSADALACDLEQWLADQPIAAQRSTIAELRTRMEADQEDYILAEQFARQMFNLGLLLAGMTRYADAVEAFAEAARRFAALHATRRRPRYQAEEANVRVSLGQALAKLGQSDEAEREADIATQIYSRLMATDPGAYRHNYATIILPPRAIPQPEPPAAAPPMTIPTSDTGTELTLTPGVSAEPASDALSGFAAEPQPVGEPPARPPDHLPVQGTLTDSGTQPEVPELSGPSTDSDARPGVPADAASETYRVPPPGLEYVQQLGRGGMADVYLVHDPALCRMVAVKELLPEFHDRYDLVVRFEREARVTARLRHPNIVAVYGYGMSAGRPYLLTEYIEGEHIGLLGQRFHESGGRLSRDDSGSARLLSAYAQAADALDYAHRQGVIHRDPKPANILVRGDGTAVVFDWGLAKDVRQTDLPAARGAAPTDMSLTSEGAMMGTPIYMSPEQARDATKVDGRSDVFILGAGLFQILTDRPAMNGRTVMDILLPLAVGNIPRPREVRPDVPVELDAICARAMAHRPEDRYQTAGELAAHLRAWMAGHLLCVTAEARRPAAPTGTRSHTPNPDSEADDCDLSQLTLPPGTPPSTTSSPPD